MPEQLTHEEIRRALKYVSDYSRDNWIRVGMALKLAGYPFEIWREWSEADPGHVWKDREGMQQWRSFKKDSGKVVTLGTVIGQAKQNGWKREAISSAEKLPELEYHPINEDPVSREPETDISAQIEKAYQELKADPDAVNHITARGLTEKTIDLFRIGYLPAGMKEAFPDLSEYQGNRFAYIYKYSFPFITLNGCRYAIFENESRAPQILEKTPKYIFPAGIRKPLYNEIIFQTDIKPETVFITEGIYDCLSIEQCGARAVALCGTAAAPLIGTLTRLNVPKETRFIIALDNDRAGTEASPKLAERLKAAGYDSIRYAFQGTKADGTPIKDANELLIANPAELARQIMTAKQEAEKLKKDADLDIPSFDEIEEKEAEWLIPGYIPKGQITMLCGSGGTGKTSVWVSLVSALSSGTKTIFDGNTPFDTVNRKPLSIIVFSAEDDASVILKKKLRKQGAKMKNIRTVLIGDKRFDEVMFGSEYLNRLLNKYRPDLCLFDPIQSFIPKNIKMSDRNAIRQTMRCLIEWGNRYGTTFLVIMHSNKLQNAWGRNRMADSADLWDIARSVLMVGETENEEIRYLSHEKSNYGKTGATMLFKTTNGMATWYGWTEEKDRDFVTALAKKRNVQKESATLEEVKEFIISTLTDYPDGLTSQELISLLRDAGYKQWAIEKAKSELKMRKMIVYKRTGKKDPWLVKKAVKS